MACTPPRLQRVARHAAVVVMARTRSGTGQRSLNSRINWNKAFMLRHKGSFGTLRSPRPNPCFFSAPGYDNPNNKVQYGRISNGKTQANSTTKNASTSKNNSSSRHFSAQAVAEEESTSPSGGSGENHVSPKVAKLVEEITLLNLKEVAELVSELKTRLNLPDTPMHGAMMPMMPMGAGVAAGADKGADAQEPEQEAEKEKAIVDIQLDGFDEKAKIKVIKEVKAISGLGLKEAKALVESHPAVILKEVKREEALEIMKTLIESGAKASLI